METKELKIKIPENHEIDWQESAKQEKIVFKKKDTKPRSWKEYLEQYKNAPCYELGFDVSGGYWSKSTIYESGYCAVPTKELAKAFKEKYPEKNVWVWSGYKFDQDLKDKDVLKYVDVLVDGQYVDELHNPTLKWKGSSNQRVIDVQKSLKENKIILAD